MKQEKIEISYQLYESSVEMNKQDEAMMNEARKATKLAYAPYSKFYVGAVAKMKNGEIVLGSNQENASFPVGLCAERVLLSSAAMLYPNMVIESIAISYHNLNGESNQPISPCGVCRQTLKEYEDRVHHPIRLILGGMEGKIMVFENASSILPFAFTSKDMK